MAKIAENLAVPAAAVTTGGSLPVGEDPGGGVVGSGTPEGQCQ